MLGERVAVLAVALAGYSTTCFGSKSRGTPPDIVLVVIDTLRADHLESYGYPRPTAPSIEALAREGVHLTLNAREPASLKEAADAIAAAHGVEVEGVVGDIAQDETQQALLDACPAPDILVNNNGGPSPWCWSWTSRFP